MARLSGFHLEGGIGKTMLDLVYPVNSLYLTAGSENPATVLGGTWAKLTGGVLAAAGTSGYAAAGATGGSKKIGVSQMPQHTHTMTKTNWQDWASNDQGIKNRMCVANGATAGAEGLGIVNNTGGGQTTSRSICPSTSGRGRRNAGGFPWLRSSFAKARRSRSTARSLSARAFLPVRPQRGLAGHDVASAWRGPLPRLGGRHLQGQQYVRLQHARAHNRRDAEPSSSASCGRGRRQRRHMGLGVAYSVAAQQQVAGRRNRKYRRRGAQQHAALARRVHVEAHRVASSGGGLHG